MTFKAAFWIVLMMIAIIGILARLGLVALMQLFSGVFQ
jgi:hypothetical protein